MKKSLSLILSATAVTVGIVALSGCNTSDNKETNAGLSFVLNSDNHSYSVKNIGTATDKEVVIPSTYNNLPVTEIKSCAFEGCSKMTSISIPDSVTSIGTWAFSGCSSLLNISIPDNVTAIWEFTFYNCSSLTNITISDNVTLISNNSFYGCKSLTDIVIPNSIIHIGSGAFDKCNLLTVYCRAESQPQGWNSSWNSEDRPVVWGFKG